MKRLGIFFFYEKNGDVDDFITYYLADARKKPDRPGRGLQTANSAPRAARPSRGPRITSSCARTRAWMSGPTKRRWIPYGWDKLSEFDEIVMTNSTLDGPRAPAERDV